MFSRSGSLENSLYSATVYIVRALSWTSNDLYFCINMYNHISGVISVTVIRCLYTRMDISHHMHTPSDGEAERMLESIHDLFLQKQKAETVSFEKKPDESIFKKPKNFKRLSKKDISTPCNFKHVSGKTEC